jgi:ABC-2 type transport system permease protein
MAGNSAFQMVQPRGWRGGLSNLMRAGFGRWYHTRLWLWQALLWTAVIDGMLAGILFSGAGPGFEDGVMLFTIFTGLFPSIAVVIIMQDAIVGEREGGTAAWVLSKPVTRSAFVLSKLFPNLVGVFVSMLLIPGIVGYALLSVSRGAPLDPLGFLAALGVMWIYVPSI